MMVEAMVNVLCVREIGVSIPVKACFVQLELEGQNWIGEGLGGVKMVGRDKDTLARRSQQVPRHRRL